MMYSVALLVIGVILILLKIYIKVTTGVYKGTERLDGKTIVVTGANSGIGLESVQDLARRGARVVMVFRDMEKAESAKKKMREAGYVNISLVHVDFSLLSSVKKCAAQILESEPRIDILLNNAGAAWEGLRNTEDGLEYIVQSNYYGPFLLTHLLLDRIKKSAPSRIINVSSAAYKFERLNIRRLDMSGVTSQIQIYCNVAFCIILYTKRLAENLRGTGVTVNCLHPGFAYTQFTRKAPTLLRFIWNKSSWFLKSAVEGAQTSIYMCASRDVQSVTGKYFADCQMYDMPKKAYNSEMSQKLWTLSEEAVKLRFPATSSVVVTRKR